MGNSILNNNEKYFPFVNAYTGLSIYLTLVLVSHALFEIMKNKTHTARLACERIFSSIINYMFGFYAMWEKPERERKRQKE